MRPAMEKGQSMKRICIFLCMLLPLAAFGTVNYGSSDANGTSLGSQSPTEIVMVDNSGAEKDSTSSISSGGGFSNTWIRAS